VASSKIGPLTLLFATTLSCGRTVAVHAQGVPLPTGTVAGTVFDSIADSPLVDAGVFLWGTPYQGSTDEDGRFRITDVPVGTYSAVFFHTRLAELAISPGAVSVHVTSGSTVDVSLATPSMYTLLLGECVLESQHPGTGRLVGWVGDARSGVGMPGARVSVSWEVRKGSPPDTKELHTDGSGWFRFCEAPAGLPLALTASFLNQTTPRSEVRVAAGDGAAVNLYMFDGLAATTVSGRLVDAATGEGVGAADVWLPGTRFHAVTDNGGRFAFSEVAPGEYTLGLSHVGYGHQTRTLNVPDGSHVAVEVRINHEAVNLAPLVVTVESGNIIEDAMSGGVTISSADVDRVRGQVRDVADVVRAQNISGLMIRRNAGGTCMGFRSGQVRMMMRNAGCVPMEVYVDNVAITNPELALEMPVDAIDHMVFYRPVEASNLFRNGGSAGVLLIFTKRR